MLGPDDSRRRAVATSVVEVMPWGCQRARIIKNSPCSPRDRRAGMPSSGAGPKMLLHFGNFPPSHGGHGRERPAGGAAPVHLSSNFPNISSTPPRRSLANPWNDPAFHLLPASAITAPHRNPCHLSADTGCGATPISASSAIRRRRIHPQHIERFGRHRRTIVAM